MSEELDEDSATKKYNFLVSLGPLKATIELPSEKNKSSPATFPALQARIHEETGLEPRFQKLLFKGKELTSSTFVT